MHEHKPSVPEHLLYVNNERQWLLFGTGHRRVAFLHCYLACQSSRDTSFLQWNADLLFLMSQEAKALKQQGFVLLALGDFNTRVGRLPGLEANTPDINSNYHMFMNFVQELNLTIVNTLSICKDTFTWFNDHSERPGTKSLLDYCLIDQDNVHNVSSFIIDEKARFRVGGDHALLECTLTFHRSQSKQNWGFKDLVQYKITDTTNYETYIQELESCISLIPITKFQHLGLPDMLNHITTSVNICANKTLGIKVFRRKKGRKLPLSVLQIIKQKNKLVSEVVGATEDGSQHMLDKKQKIMVCRCIY